MEGEDEEQRQNDEQRRQLFRRVEFGLNVRQFLDGAIGRRMLNDSTAEKEVIKDALVGIDGDTEDGRKEERALRLRFAALNQWQVFFQEYIDAGDDAEAILRQSETQGLHEGDEP